MMKKILATTSSIALLFASGCTINVGSSDQQAQEPAQKEQQQANNNQEDNPTQQNDQDKKNDAQNEIGVEKKVGDFKITVNSLEIVEGKLCIHVKLINTGHLLESLDLEDTIVTDGKGNTSKGRATLPFEAAQAGAINAYLHSLRAGESADDIVMSFDVSEGPFTLTITRNGETATWKLQQP